MNLKVRPRTAVFVPSHITYDSQLGYLNECIHSLLNQTMKVDVYISISCAPKYENEVRLLQIKYKTSHVKFLIRDKQTSQMNHIRILTKKFADNHDLILFCDDDDTYEPKRVERFNAINDLIMNESRDGIVLVENFKINEFWNYALLPKQLHDFFRKFQSPVHNNYLNGLFGDMIFRAFLTHRHGAQRMQIQFDPKPDRLYNHRKHNESITGSGRHIPTNEDPLLLLCACGLNFMTYNTWLSFPHEKVKTVMKFIWVNLCERPEYFKKCMRIHKKKMSPDKVHSMLLNV